MERRQLEFFLAITEAGSFTRASQVLHIAQPSLSHSMRTLEAELGSPLFERHGRGVRLTAAGEALVGPARRAVRSFGLAASAVRGVVEGDVGVLRIVSSTSWAVHPLVGLIGEFRRLRPQVRFEVTDPAAALGGARPGPHRPGRLRARGRSARRRGRSPASSWPSSSCSPCCRRARGPQTAPRRSTSSLQHGLIGTPRGTALRDPPGRAARGRRPADRRDGRDRARRLGRAPGPLRCGSGGAARGDGRRRGDQGRAGGAPGAARAGPPVSLVWRRVELDGIVDPLPGPRSASTRPTARADALPRHGASRAFRVGHRPRSMRCRSQPVWLPALLRLDQAMP